MAAFEIFIPILFIYKVNNKGPRIEPWGTSLWANSEETSSNLASVFKIICKHPTACTENPAAIRHSIKISKALETYIKRERQHCLSSKASLMSFITFKAAVVVLCFLWNPDWEISRPEIVASYSSKGG